MEIQWYYEWGVWEYVWITLFFAFYFFYLYRVGKSPYLRGYAILWLLSKFGLRAIYFGLLLVALLGPSFGYGTRFVQTVGKDIYILLDVSLSMTSQDIVPSRLEKIKYELQNLFKTFPSDRFGLIVYSSEAFVQCPLTFDKNVLHLTLQNARPELMPNGSTYIESALELGYERILPNRNKFVDVKSKLILLISDGEDFGANTASILQKYTQKGIKVFTIGVGTAQGGNIPTPRGLLYDNQGKVVVTKLFRSTLQEIAQRTGGQYFEISNQRNDLSQLVQILQQIKGQRLDLRSVDVSFNKYEYFLWVSLFLILLDIIFIVKVMKI